MKAFVARNPFATFAFLTLLFQFGIVLGVNSMLEPGMLIHDDPKAHMLFRFRVFGPLFFCIAITYYIEKTKGLKKLFSSFFVWRIPARWYGVALFWKFILGYLGLVFIGLIFNFWPESWFAPNFWLGWGSNILFIGGIAFVEETAWISFSLGKMQARHSAFKSVLIVGCCWAMWYMPMVAINEGVPAGYPIPVFFTSMLALTVLLAWMYNTTRSGVVLLCAQFISNTAFFIVPILPEVVSSEAAKAIGDFEVRPITAFVSVFVVTAIIIVLKFGREDLSKRERAKWVTPQP